MVLHDAVLAVLILPIWSFFQKFILAVICMRNEMRNDFEGKPD